MNEGQPRLTPHPPPLRPGGNGPGMPPSRPAVVPPPMMPPSQKDLDPISLIEEQDHSHDSPHSPPPPAKKITFGTEMQHKKHAWKRTPFKNGQGAVRVKTFHGKYSEQGLEYLDNAVNEWLDANPDVEVKFVTPTVLQFEGKIRENALVLNVWY